MNQPTLPHELILASTSRYRSLLLQRLGLPFRMIAPGITETPLAGESAARLVRRLASAKAQAVGATLPRAVVIGSDQSAVIRGRIMGKPGTAEAAEEQLIHCSGKSVEFLTSVTVLCAASGFLQTAVVATSVRFRALTRAEIRRYISQDQPLDCAGSFKSEAAGPMLLETMRSDDPSAIIGLPLISLSRLLRASGFLLP